VFGLDGWVAGFSDGTSLLVMAAVAIVLGLRHATDPDHLAAVTTLVASGRARSAARLGGVWGAGHATSLLALGTPIVLYRAYLPESIQRDAETAVGAIIVVLALSLLARARRGEFHVHVHEHGGARHAHGVRTPWQAYVVGLAHGAGGSAGVGVLLLASIADHAVALVALSLFAICTAVSMALVSSGFGWTLTRPSTQRTFARLAPVFGLASLAFGIWYALGAQDLVPYYL
jgi:high-affinity nickel permease